MQVACEPPAACALTALCPAARPTPGRTACHRTLADRVLTLWLVLILGGSTIALYLFVEYFPWFIVKFLLDWVEVLLGFVLFGPQNFWLGRVLMQRKREKQELNDDEEDEWKVLRPLGVSVCV